MYGADNQFPVGIDDCGAIEDSRGYLAIGLLAFACQILPDDDAEEDEKDCSCGDAGR